jgi:hypothetical protein
VSEVEVEVEALAVRRACRRFVEGEVWAEDELLPGRRVPDRSDDDEDCSRRTEDVVRGGRRSGSEAMGGLPPLKRREKRAAAPLADVPPERAVWPEKTEAESAWLSVGEAMPSWTEAMWARWRSCQSSTTREARGFVARRKMEVTVEREERMDEALALRLGA